MTMNILALDMPPEEVADTYQRLRESAGLSRRGRKIDGESEILCLAALEAKEMDGCGKEDAGFREAVLRRYSAKAKLHDVDPARFTSSRASWDKARRVLRRAEAAYARLYPSSAVPVKTPDGPRTLVSDEPDLFSREKELPFRIV
jgi:hypothetical protein